MNHLTLKNLAIFPSYFSTTTSLDTTIQWANVNFQEFGIKNERVWQFNGSGFKNSPFTTITYTIATPYDIGFEGPGS